MSGGFGLPVLNLQSALGSLGTAYDASYEKERSRTALAKLGERLKVGDYAGAASTAFDGGDPQTGIGLLKLGQAQRQQQLGVEATRDLAASFGLGGPQDGGTQGYGPRADAPPASRAVPSFAETGGPAGDYMAGLFKRESNNNPNAQASTSSARGLGQFTKGTWNAVAAQHPDLGLVPVGNGQDGRIDAQQMVRATQAHTADNEGILSRAGLPVNDATRYSLHIFGAGGGPRFVAGAMRNPDAPAAAYVKPDQVAANRPVFFNRDGSPKSAGQVMSDFGRSFGGGGGGSQQAAAPTGAGQVAYADDEAQTQALEQRMGMVPRQTASTDPRADMPAEGSEPANFQTPGGSNAIPPGLSGNGVLRARTIPPSSDPNARNVPPSGIQAPAVPTLGGPAPTGRRMTMPGEDGGGEQAAPVQVAENTMVGGVPAGVVAQAPPQQRIQALQRALLNPNTPDGVRQFASTMLKQTLDDTKMPDGVKEFVYARAHGWTQAQTPGAYAQEKLRNPGVDLKSQIDVRESEATRLGLQPGSPEYRSYALTGKEATTKTERDEGAKITSALEARKAAAPGLGLEEGSPAWRSYVGAGKLGADRDMSAGEKKSIETADGLALTGRQSIAALQEAKNLSAKAYAGPLAGFRGQVTGTLGYEAGQATTELDNLVTSNALTSLKATFGAAPTEGERKILLDIQGSSNLPHALRTKIYDRAIAAAELRAGQNEDKADAIRNGTYFKRGGGAAVRGAGGAVEPETAAPRSLPAPSPSNRPGAVPVADRFKQLSASGLSKADVYQRLHDEGY